MNYMKQNVAVFGVLRSQSTRTTQILKETGVHCIEYWVTGETGTRTADEFATYFKDKINSVRVSTASTPLFDVPTKRGRHWHSGLP